ncbi:MAG: hypothetical protein V1819_00875 [bacterium]
MNPLKIIGFGILIWVVAFVVVSPFIAFKIPLTDAVVKISTVLAVFIITLLLAKNFKPSSQIMAISVGLIWAAIVLALDYLITVKFTTTSIFGDWNVMVGYLLIILTPLLTVKKGK